ncbi:MAG: glycosyltransferase family protein [Phocaeicola sp.]
MKFLFIVQGEGRGHLTQAITLEEILRRNGHEVVEVLVGKSSVRQLPGFFNRSMHAPIKRFISPNFLPAPDQKGVDMSRSVIYNLLKTTTYLKSIHYIHQRIQQSGADCVINFYELLTGLTYTLLRPSIPYVCIGHQYLFLHPEFKFPAKSKRSIWWLKFFTKLTSVGAKERLALSFRSFTRVKEGIRVVPPLLRRDVELHEPTKGDYLHGYMLNAGFAQNVSEWHAAHPETPLRFFWDKWGEEPVKKVDDTLSFYQLDDMEFLKQMAGCKGYASTAGFESICEAMYLGKPILMVPAHIEQACNAFDAVQNGAGVLADGFDLSKLLELSHSYQPNREFVEWTRTAESSILELLENGIVEPRRELETEVAALAVV